MITAESNTYVDLAVGQLWQIRVCSTEAPILVVINPDGSTLAPAVDFEAETSLGLGHYLAEIAVQEPGRYIAAVTSASWSGLTFQAAVAELTMNTDLPTFEDLDEYLGGAGAHSWTDDQLTDALNAESANQRRVCQIPAAYPDDLRQALLRRGARNLAMRRQMTEQPRTDGDFDSPAFVPPGRDAEIRRFEAPWRKIVTG